MTGPYPPDHGTVPSEVTVTRDGDEVVVCGVRLPTDRVLTLIQHLNMLADDIRRDQTRRHKEAEREKRRRQWAAEAVAVAELPSGVPVRLVADGRIDAGGAVWYSNVRSTLSALLAGCPTPRRLWWVGSRGMMHLDRCGCNHDDALWLALLLPADERPAKVCKRSARKLSAKVTP